MNKKCLENLICNVIRNVIKSEPLRPITDLVELYASNGTLHIGATDGSTRIVGTIDCDVEFDNIVVSLSKITRLINLTTKDNISLKVVDGYLQFKGNGNYKIPEQLNESGGKLSLNLSMPDFNAEPIEVGIDGLNTAITRNSLSLYSGDTQSFLKRYYHKDGRIITTDCATMCVSKGILPLDEMYPKMVQQLACMPDTFKFLDMGSGYRVECDNINMFMLLERATGFPIETVQPLLGLTATVTNKVSINKDELLGLIKRAELFNSALDTIPSICFTASNNIITAHSSDGSFCETLNTDNTNVSDFDMKFSLKYLGSFLRKVSGSLTLYFGDNLMIIEDELGYYILSMLGGKE